MTTGMVDKVRAGGLFYLDFTVSQQLDDESVRWI